MTEENLCNMGKILKYEQECNRKLCIVCGADYEYWKEMLGEDHYCFVDGEKITKENRDEFIRRTG